MGPSCFKKWGSGSTINAETPLWASTKKVLSSIFQGLLTQSSAKGTKAFPTNCSSFSTDLSILPSIAAIKYYSMLFLFLFLLSASLACSPNCLLCDSNISLCYACKDSQLPAIGGGCQNVASRINGCLVYLNTTGCARCRLGHRLTVLMTCEMDRRGCLIFTINGSCSECGFGTRLENGSCTGVLNCLFYKPQSNSLCLECYDGFKLIDNRCVYSSPCGVVSQKDGSC